MTDDQLLAEFHRDVMAASVEAQTRFKLHDFSRWRVPKPFIIREGWRKVASFDNKDVAKAHYDVLWRSTAIRDALRALATRQLDSTQRLTHVLTDYLSFRGR